MKEPKLREVIDSPNLDHYKKIPKRITDKLKAFDKMLGFLAGSKSVPCLRLYRADWVDLDTIVRVQSDGKRDLSSVQYRGYPITRGSE